jgi:hypothetical protein
VTSITDGDFADWVEFHTTATGAPPGVAEMFGKNRETLGGRFRATLSELCDVTNEIVLSGKIPKYANEHLEAVIREVRRARDERAVKARPDAADDDYTRPPTCACGGTGLVVVPHPKCVWNGKLVLNRPGGRVLTTAVMCDAAGCVAGARVRKDEAERQRKENDRGDRFTLSNYHRRVGLSNGPAALAEYERDEAEKVRRNLGPGSLAGLYGSLMSKVQERRDAA